MPVSWTDLIHAFEFVSSSSTDEHQPFLCKQTGKLYWTSDTAADDMDELASVIRAERVGTP
jgi:hypothetical protein